MYVVNTYDACVHTYKTILWAIRRLGGVRGDSQKEPQKDHSKGFAQGFKKEPQKDSQKGCTSSSHMAHTENCIPESLASVVV
jgi:hypothetical protein